MQVVVIGAGVLGASIACRLAGEGQRVTLVDLAPGGIASRGSFGWLNAASAADEHYARTRIHALDLWRRLADEHPDCPVAFPGFLLWDEPPAALERMARDLPALGHAAELVDRAAIARLEPALALAPEAALWLPGEGRTEPRAIAAWFAGAAVVAGATLRPERVVALDRAGTGWTLRLATGMLTAEAVVVAAGTATPDLLAPLGLRLRLAPEPGLLVRSAPARPALGRMLGSPGLHLWQAADGAVLAGADYGGGNAAEPDTGKEARAILDRAQALVPALGPLAPAAVTVADRPMLPDDRPAVGRLAEGLIVAVTHSGMTLAPLIAGAVAADIAGRAAEPLLAPYGPDRPAVRGAPADTGRTAP